jgi:WD40 repeat protein
MSGMKDARFSPDGEQVAIAAGDGSIRLWDIQRREIVHRYGPSPLVETLAFSDDGQSIVTGSANGAVRIWSADDESLQTTLQLLWRVGDLDFVKDQRVLAMATSGGGLHLYDLDTQREVNHLSTHNRSLGVLDRAADGTVMAVGSGDGSVKLVRIAELMKPDVYWHDANVRAVKFLLDGQRVAAASTDGALRIWNLRTGKSRELGEPTGRPLTSLAIQPGGKRIAVAGPTSKVTLWDCDTLELVESVEGTDDGALALDFSPSGNLLAVATPAGPILIYQDDKWSAPHAQIEKRGAEVTTLCYAPDRNAITIAYQNGEVRFFDGGSANEQRPPIQLTAMPIALGYGEQGRVLAIGTDSGEIHLWDRDSKKTRHVIKGHSGRVNTLAVMPNQTTLVSAGRDNEVKLWDTATGERITILAGHLRQVHAVAVSPDGNAIASGGLQGDLRLWRSKPR